MKIVIGCDEAAFDMKEAVHQRLKELQYDVIDVGVYDKNPSLYPDTAEKLCKEIVEGRAEKPVSEWRSQPIKYQAFAQP